MRERPTFTMPSFGRFELLASSPRIGARSRLLSGGMRQWRVFNYAVLYDAESEPLRIVRIAHGSRDLPRIFGAPDHPR